MSVFGALYADIDLDPTPALSRDQAVARVERLTGVRPGPSRQPELMVLPKPGGGYALTWRARVFARGDIRVYFLDARTGDVVFDYSDWRPSRRSARAAACWATRRRSARPRRPARSWRATGCARRRSHLRHAGRRAADDRLPERGDRPRHGRPGERHRQRLVGRRERGRARLLGLGLRLLLQAVRPSRARQREPAHAEPRPPRAPQRPVGLLERHRRHVLPERLLRRRRRDGVRRRAAAGRHLPRQRPDRGLLLGRPRHRRPRADARRDRLHLAAHLPATSRARSTRRSPTSWARASSSTTSRRAAASSRPTT